MNDDHVFRIAMLSLLLMILPIGVYHRVRSQLTGEKLDRRQEGLFMLLTLRPAGIAVWVGLMVFLIDPARMAWSSVHLPAWLRWTGVGVGFLAVLLLAWTFQRLGKNLTDTVVTRRNHTLVTQGPYRWVRHPFYDSAVLMAFAASLIAANWFFFAGACVFFGLCAIRTRTEEAKLLARFGDSYQAYMDRTGRFWPRILPSRRGV